MALPPDYYTRDYTKAEMQEKLTKEFFNGWASDRPRSLASWYCSLEEWAARQFAVTARGRNNAEKGLNYENGPVL